MYYIVFALLPLVAMATTPQCNSTLPEAEFRSMFCSATVTVVFRGNKVRGSSSIAVDRQGNQETYSHVEFQVTKAYKGDGVETGDSIWVSRTWTQADSCSSTAFPHDASDFLVFATAGNPDHTFYTVETCRHSFPWDGCVPAAFKVSLDNDDVQCP